MSDPLDLADVEARIERHRCRANIQRSRDADVADLSRLIDQDAPALVADARLLRRKLTLLFLAAEAVESEADGENRSSRGLADMRRIMNAIPVGFLDNTPAAEVVEQDEAVSS